jgi:hypothetical protein
MRTTSAHVATLPPFSNQHGCPACGAHREIRVHFDRDCAEVTGGDHFHRVCSCGNRWVELDQRRAVEAHAGIARQAPTTAPSTR